MTSWQIGESGTAVVLDEQGRGEVTFTVTNTAAQQDRAMLTIVPLDGAAEAWFTVEEPQRAVPAGGSVVYRVQVAVPAGTATGVYGFQAMAYSADRDPGESSATSRRLTVEVRDAAAPPPRRFPWWILAVVAAAVLLVIIVLFVILRDGGSDRSPEETVQAYLRAFIDEDCETAVDLVTEASWSGLADQTEPASREEAIEGCEALIAEVGVDFLRSLDVFELISEDGDRAVVQIDSSTDEEVEVESVTLLREDGEWKLDFSEDLEEELEEPSG